MVPLWNSSVKKISLLGMKIFESLKSRCTMEFYFERKEIVVQPRQIAYSGFRERYNLIQFLQNKSFQGRRSCSFTPLLVSTTVLRKYETLLVLS